MNFMNSIALGAEDFGIFNFVGGGATTMMVCVLFIKCGKQELTHLHELVNGTRPSESQKKHC